MIIDIALKIGSSNTSIFMSGHGLVLREPTLAAFTGGVDARALRAAGISAKEMQGKTPDKTLVVRPVKNGVVADIAAGEIMLRHFLKKIAPERSFFPPKFRALVAIPCGLSAEERCDYEEVCFSAGVTSVTLIESAIPAALGADLPVNTPDGGFIIDIGGGGTDIAAISLSGIVKGCGVNVGGDLMDKAIIDFVASRHNLQIGQATAERAKKEIGSLFENDNSGMTVSGVDLAAHKPASAVIRAKEIGEAVAGFYDAIADAAESIIRRCPPEVASRIYRSGVWLTGGGAKIHGLDKYVADKLRLTATVADDPENAVVLGAGKLLGNTELLEEILEQA